MRLNRPARTTNREQSWVAVDTKGTIFEIQRGNKADPVLVLDPRGRVLRSWGKGGYTIPHSIRLDAAGNVWTVDAASLIVTKYSPLGEKLLTIKVDGQPVNGSLFNGATDIAFGRRGRIFITDGYGNARVLEYTPDGRRLKQWGRRALDRASSICRMRSRSARKARST